jgi:hypothetical protein
MSAFQNAFDATYDQASQMSDQELLNADLDELGPLSGYNYDPELQAGWLAAMTTAKIDRANGIDTSGSNNASGGVIGFIRGLFN